jgi:hypothetical protein
MVRVSEAILHDKWKTCEDSISKSGIKSSRKKRRKRRFGYVQRRDCDEKEFMKWNCRLAGDTPGILVSLPTMFAPSLMIVPMERITASKMMVRTTLETKCLTEGFRRTRVRGWLVAATRKTCWNALE